ncbi:MAG: exodeoxyribonuclease VII large subunit [Helicobacteraceae bacterium]|nr:exodeoxyribonuclease VII large subunit [Helicobacteraceae bacterium]
MQTLTVSSLNEQIKNLLETTFVRVFVEGEISRITYHNSGHIYFSLKDSSSAIKGVMFRGNATKLRFRLEEGLKVIVDGAISLYKPRGEYQLNCFNIDPAGHGALALAYEQLKSKLYDQGYFNNKKIIPKFAKSIALITSATSAALQDMLRVATERYPLVKIVVYDSLVQGANAKFEISQNIALADTKGHDIIVVGRGGGSLEDLWAFNEEIVADAIFNAVTPIVSAVGHEIDFLISDEVADLRAPTPSAAMQMILPDKNELLMMIDSQRDHFSSLISQKLSLKKEQLSSITNLFKANSIDQKISLKLEEVSRLKTSLSQTINFVLERKRLQLEEQQRIFKLNHPSTKIKKGFVQISQNSKTIELEKLALNDEFKIMDEKLIVTSKVIKKEAIK